MLTSGRSSFLFDLKDETQQRKMETTNPSRIIAKPATMSHPYALISFKKWMPFRPWEHNVAVAPAIGPSYATRPIRPVQAEQAANKLTAF